MTEARQRDVDMMNGCGMAERWLRSAWLDLLISLLVAAAEAAIVAPWLQVLAGLTGHSGDSTPSPVGLAIVGFASFWSVRAFLQGGWEISATRAMSLGIFLALMIGWSGIASGNILSAPWTFIDRLVRLDGSLVVLLLLGVLAWWRGISLAVEPAPFTPEFTRRLMGRGVLAVGAALIVAAVAGDPTAGQVSDSAVVALPVLLVAGLSAAGAVQVKLARESAGSGVDSERAGLGWLAAASGLSLGLLLLAVIVAGIAGRDVWGALFHPLGLLLDLLQTVAFWLLTGFAYLVFLLLSPLFWLLRQLGGGQAEQLPQPVQPGLGEFDQFARNTERALPDALLTVLETAGVVLLLALLLVLALRSLRRYRAGAQDRPVDEIHESVWSRDLALAQLGGILDGLRPRRTRRPRAAGFDLDAEPASVRDAYRHLLALGRREGIPREAHETAADYAARLHATWSAAGEPIDDLTLRYLAARYAELTTEVDVEQARRDWREIRQRVISRLGHE